MKRAGMAGAVVTLFLVSAPLMAFNEGNRQKDARQTSRLFQRFDADRNGVITMREWPGTRKRFIRLDRNGDGRITQAELDARAKNIRKSR
jgi:Ca2+-binding EF-hand superfamily protein